MPWTFKLYQTSTFGRIISETDVLDIENDFKIEKTVGDQMWIKSGDITINTRKALANTPFTWLAAILDGKVFDIYTVENIYDEFDEKFGKYKIRLLSIQKQFFDDINATVMAYSATADDWGNSAASTNLIIDEIRYVDEFGVPTVAQGRHGFSLGDILQSISGSNSNGYSVQSVSFPGPTMNQNNVPVIYRGISQSVFLQGSPTAIEAFDLTFKDHNSTWMDMFKLAIFGFNSFVRANPSIFKSGVDDFVGLSVSIVPRVNVSPGTTKSPRWLKRKVSRGKFQLDGVHIKSSINDINGNPSFEFKQGDIDGNEVFKRDADIGDPSSSIKSGDTTLYWSDGTYNATSGKYEILDVSSNPLPYFASGLVEPFYAGLLTSGDAIEGTVIYEDEDILDHIAIGADIIQLNKITKGRQGLKMKVQGFKIA